MVRTKWADVRRPLSPEREAAARGEVQAELSVMKLSELGRQRGLSRETNADVPDIGGEDVGRSGDRVNRVPRRRPSHRAEP